MGMIGGENWERKSKVLKIFEPFNPKRFLLELWPLPVCTAVGSKGLSETSGPGTRFTDGETEAHEQKSPQRVSASGDWGSHSTEARIQRAGFFCCL